MTTVLVCDEGEAPASLELDGARVVVIDGLCRRLDQLAAWTPDDEDHLVLATHRNHIDLGSLQAAVRRIGFDPLLVGQVDLQAIGADDDVEFTLAAAVARSRCISPTPTEQVKLLSPDRSTRRALLSIGKPRYISAPGVDPLGCRAADGCRVCVDSCPSGALAWSAGSVGHDINACVVCGICTTVCPAGAVENPASTVDAIEAELEAAIHHAGGPIGVRFRCRHAIVPAEAGWYQLEVPCTGMLTIGWVLSPLVMGACAVDVVTCSAGGCPFRLDDRTSATLGDVAAITDWLGIALERPLDWHRVQSAHRAGSLLAAPATSHVLDMLAAGDLEPLQLRVGDIGSVEIDPGACTACERCASSCPSEALGLEHPDDTTRITFDPRSCTACMTCISVCPEIEQGAISVRREVNVADRERGRRTVREEQVATCEICGRPVAPVAMLARIESMLGEDAGPTMSVIGGRCLDCRGR